MSNIKELIKSKELIEKKINLNNTLLDTIRIIKQDEEVIQEENKAYRVILKLVKRELKKEYK